MPDQASPPPRPKPTPAELRARRAERVEAVRLRALIGRELDERGITDPAAIGEALGLPTREADLLLGRHQWREGDVAALLAAATRLGVPIPRTGSQGGT